LIHNSINFAWKGKDHKAVSPAALNPFTARSQRSHDVAAGNDAAAEIVFRETEKAKLKVQTDGRPSIH
jgi:hypothetical protein